MSAPTRVGQRLQRTRKPLRVVLQEQIELRLNDGRTVIISPTVQHRLSTEWSGLGDSASFEFEPLEHEFDLIVTREHFEIHHKASSDEEADALWSDVRSTLALPECARARDHDHRIRDAEGEVWLAYVDVGEFPAHIAAPGGHWFDVLDATGDSVADAGDIIDAIVREPDRFGMECPLVFGSLLWPQILAVHPRLRGQGIGLQLLAHALWALHRGSGDVVFVHAAAASNHFDKLPPERDEESYAALCRYYERLGFRRWHKRRRPSDPDGGSFMILALGTHGANAVHPSGAPLIA